jgi:hypothetical protein
LEASRLLAFCCVSLELLWGYPSPFLFCYVHLRSVIVAFLAALCDLKLLLFSCICPEPGLVRPRDQHCRNRWLHRPVAAASRTLFCFELSLQLLGSFTSAPTYFIPYFMFLMGTKCITPMRTHISPDQFVAHATLYKFSSQLSLFLDSQEILRTNRDQRQNKPVSTALIRLPQIRTTNTDAISSRSGCRRRCTVKQRFPKRLCAAF